jgi:hypothetical protein
MNRVKTSLAIAAILCASTFAFAHDGMNQGQGPQSGHHGQGHGGMMNSRMKSMDTNNDGLVSKAEFMKGHEAMWDSMPKDKSGQISIADMEKAHQARMADRHTRKHEEMMEHHEKMMQEHEKMMDESESETKDEAAKDEPAKQ